MVGVGVGNLDSNTTARNTAEFIIRRKEKIKRNQEN